MEAAAQSVYPFEQKCPFAPPEELTWRRRNAPVSQVRLANGSTAWLVTRYDDVRTVLTDPRFSRRQVREAAMRGGPPGAPAPAPQGGGARTTPPPPGRFDFGMSLSDPDRHAAWRRTLASVLTPRHAESLRERVARAVEETLDELQGGPQPADLVSGFAYQVPVRVLCELFDLPDDVRPAFRAWAALVRAAAPSTAAFGEAMGSLYGVARRLVDKERAAPGQGVIGLLLTAAGEEAAPTDEELLTTVMLLATAGYESTAVQFANGLLALFQHPGEAARLRAGQVSAAAAVEEILRYAQAGTGFAGTTVTTEDVRLGGETIPAGSTVFISLDSAGRDESHTERPDEFDLGQGAPHHHLTFGAGSHFCLGAALARVELQEGITRLLRRFPTLRPHGSPDAVEFTANLFHRYPRELTVVWS
ncbi:cytochrome P450 [Streptomyces afghaniensis]|uniref:cytochrome P450 n=1 Tax=Streptomyces afghaniensis TaxID=66865 RepID=UPI003796D7CA